MSTGYAESHSLSGPEDAQDVAFPSATQLLFMCDFPPANSRGGAVSLSRLLSGYPSENLTVLTGSQHYSISPAEGRLSCRHVVFPATSETGRLGLGRLKCLADWLLLPLLSIVAIWLIKRSRTKVVLTVAHGHFFIAGALACLLTSTPLVLIVHDDWVPAVNSSSYVLKYFSATIFRLVARSAAHIYVVSPPMREMLRREYGVASDLQMPAATPAQQFSSANHDGQTLKIVYAGTGTAAVEDSLELLIELVRGNLLQDYGVANWELHLYTPIDLSHPAQRLWNHNRIHLHGWVDQTTLQSAVLNADILFLPFSFHEEERYSTERAFPAKTADYLASGNPILVLAPPYSSIVQYFKSLECGAVVDRPNLELLAGTISEIWRSDELRRQLRLRALKAFDRNHRIESQRLALNELLLKLGNRLPYQGL